MNKHVLSSKPRPPWHGPCWVVLRSCEGRFCRMVWSFAIDRLAGPVTNSPAAAQRHSFESHPKSQRVEFLCGRLVMFRVNLGCVALLEEEDLAHTMNPDPLLVEVVLHQEPVAVKAVMASQTLRTNPHEATTIPQRRGNHVQSAGPNPRPTRQKEQKCCLSGHWAPASGFGPRPSYTGSVSRWVWLGEPCKHKTTPQNQERNDNCTQTPCQCCGFESLPKKKNNTLELIFPSP